MSMYAFYVAGLAVYRKGGVILPALTAVREGLDAKVPSRFSVSQNYPNPFNARTTIRYALADASRVEIEILDMRGQKVRTLVRRRQSAGEHQVVWDGTGGDGQVVGSGVYV